MQLRALACAHDWQHITPALNQTPMESPSCAGSGHAMGPSRRWTSRKDYLDLRVGVLKGLFGSYVPSPCFQSSCSYDEFPKDSLRSTYGTKYVQTMPSEWWCMPIQRPFWSRMLGATAGIPLNVLRVRLLGDSKKKTECSVIYLHADSNKANSHNPSRYGFP